MTIRTTAMTMTTMMTTIKEKPPLKLRHELKYRISLRDDRILASRLGKLFPRDKNAGAEGSYRITSLYFDTPSDTALRQKLEGVDRREKFRLRYYGEDLSFIRLEKKFKMNGLCGKHSARVTREQVRDILEGRPEVLLDGREPLLTEFYTKLRGQLLTPKTIVSYDREAFCFGPGNVRITIDRNLRAGRSAGDFLSPGKPKIPAGEGGSVLEVKYDAFLPDIVRMAVQVPNRQAAACSKYALCRRYD